jgi:hypothetical protein
MKQESSFTNYQKKTELSLQYKEIFQFPTLLYKILLSLFNIFIIVYYKNVDEKLSMGDSHL